MRKILSHPLIVVTFFPLLFILSGVVWAYVALHGIREPLIVHFAHYAGITHIGSLFDIYGMGLLGIIIVLINTRIIQAFRGRGERIWAGIVMGANLFFSLLLFLSLIAIMSVN